MERKIAACKNVNTFLGGLIFRLIYDGSALVQLMLKLKGLPQCVVAEFYYTGAECLAEKL